MADYTSQPPVPQEPVVPSGDPAPAPPPVQVSPPADPNRPVSTIPADPSVLPASPPADYIQTPESVMSGSSVLTPSDSPADPLASSSATLAAPVSPSEPAQSANETLPVLPITTDVLTQIQSNPIQSEQAADSPSSPVVPQEPQAPVSPHLSVSSPPEPTEQGSVKDSFGVQKPSQMQSSPSEQAPSGIDAQPPEMKPESAGINSEPPQARQEAPSADLSVEASAKSDSQPAAEPKQSFGNLISEPQPPAQAPVPSIPDAVQPLPDLSIPSVPSMPSVVVGSSLPNLSEKRKQAIQARKQRVADHLEKIVAFVSQKGKASNHDIRDLLHVSQTTVSNYCHTLVSNGKLKREGKAKATTYSLPQDWR